MPHASADAGRHLVGRVTAGDETAEERLLPLLYGELRLLAHRRMAKLPPGNTLDTTALVHETYLREAGKDEAHWDGRRHFFFAAARAMHDLLVEQARRKASLRRGGGRQRRSLDGVVLPFEKPPEDILALHEALGALAVGGVRHFLPPLVTRSRCQALSSTSRDTRRPTSDLAMAAASAPEQCRNASGAVNAAMLARAGPLHWV